jgi:hypothetical protein
MIALEYGTFDMLAGSVRIPSVSTLSMPGTYLRELMSEPASRSGYQVFLLVRKRYTSKEAWISKVELMMLCKVCDISLQSHPLLDTCHLNWVESHTGITLISRSPTMAF